MSDTMERRQGGHRPGAVPSVALDADAVRAAYRRWAAYYDAAFGSVSAFGRRRAAGLANSLPGSEVLEVGVGTGLALPRYRPEKRVTGIDLSADMLRQARKRASDFGLRNVAGLREMDAEETDFEDGAFDIAVAMFVASVVPHPRKLLAEMRRVVKPGGHILFVNHFAARRGPRWWIERAMAPASHALGWHPDFAVEALFSPEDLVQTSFERVPPFGIFTLVRMPN